MSKSVTQYITITNIDNNKATQPNRISSKTNEIQLSIQFDNGKYYLSAIPVEVMPLGGDRLIGMTVGTGARVPVHEATRNTAKQRAIATALACDAAIDVLRKCEEKYGTEFEIPEAFFPDAEKLSPTSGGTKEKSTRNKLVTAEILRKFRAHPIGSQDGKGENATVLAKYFGGSAYTFLVTEAKYTEEGDWVLYGKATHGHGWEWGYTMLSDLEHLKFPITGTGVERDRYISSDATVAELSA